MIPSQDTRHENRSTPPKTLRSSYASLPLALPVSLTETEAESLQSVITSTLALKRAQPLYRAGDRFTSVFIVRAGSLMTSILTEDGREQVTGFPIMGDILALDAISEHRYSSTALALEDSLVYELPFDALMEKSAEIPGLQRKLFQLMSREIVKDQGQMMLLGNLNVEERLAAFLINLSESHRSRGFSSTAFQLRMRREDIGSYLGTKLETISRTFSKFQSLGLIRVHMRELEIVDLKRLKAIVDSVTTRAVH